MCRSITNSEAGAAIEAAMSAKIARVDFNMVGIRCDWEGARTATGISKTQK